MVARNPCPEFYVKGCKEWPAITVVNTVGISLLRQYLIIRGIKGHVISRAVTALWKEVPVNGKTVLFKTIHGSRLYGLAHENSDEDFYTVVDKVKNQKARYARQSIVGDEDSMVVDFGTWVDMCKSGVPQALEAMFSDHAVYDGIEEFRKSFRVGTQVYDRYLRTIKSFALTETDPFKRKRHSLRLALNFKEMRGTGRFNPTLTPAQAAGISDMAELWTGEEVYEFALGLAWS